MEQQDAIAQLPDATTTAVVSQQEQEVSSIMETKKTEETQQQQVTPSQPQHQQPIVQDKFIPLTPVEDVELLSKDQKHELDMHSRSFWFLGLPSQIIFCMFFWSIYSRFIRDLYFWSLNITGFSAYTVIAVFILVPIPLSCIQPFIKWFLFYFVTPIRFLILLILGLYNIEAILLRNIVLGVGLVLTVWEQEWLLSHSSNAIRKRHRFSLFLSIVLLASIRFVNFTVNPLWYHWQFNLFIIIIAVAAMCFLFFEEILFMQKSREKHWNLLDNNHTTRLFYSSFIWKTWNQLRNHQFSSKGQKVSFFVVGWICRLIASVLLCLAMASALFLLLRSFGQTTAYPKFVGISEYPYGFLVILIPLLGLLVFHIHLSKTILVYVLVLLSFLLYTFLEEPTVAFLSGLFYLLLFPSLFLTLTKELSCNYVSGTFTCAVAVSILYIFAMIGSVTKNYVPIFGPIFSSRQWLVNLIAILLVGLLYPAAVLDRLMIFVNHFVEMKNLMRSHLTSLVEEKQTQEIEMKQFNEAEQEKQLVQTVGKIPDSKPDSLGKHIVLTFLYPTYYSLHNRYSATSQLNKFFSKQAKHTDFRDLRSLFHISSVPSVLYFIISLIILLFAIFGVLVRGTATNLIPPQSMFRIGTYNVYQGFDFYGLSNFDQIETTIRQYRASTVGFQECDTNMITSDSEDLMSFLSAKLGMSVYQGLPSKQSSVGCCVLTKYPIVEAKSFVMPFNNKAYTLERPLCRTVLDVDDELIYLYTTHVEFAVIEDARLQVRFILDTIEKTAPANAPVIVMGDFNAAPTTETIQMMLNSTLGLKSAYAESHNGTYAQTFPYKPYDPSATVLDYVFFKNLQLVNSTVVYVTASDHVPIIVDFKSLRT